MNLPDEKYDSLLGSDELKSGKFEPPLVNIGDLAQIVKRVVGFGG